MSRLGTLSAIAASLAVAALDDRGILSVLSAADQRTGPGKRPNAPKAGDRTYRPGGAREVARYTRQIAAGHKGAANGVIR